MAFAKREPVLDTKPKLQGAVVPVDTRQHGLNGHDFGTFVRLIKRGREAQVQQLKVVIDQNLKRLRLRTKGAVPVDGIPEGSDQCDVGTMVAWITGIQKRDSTAKEQLVSLAATLNRRIS